MDKELEVTQKIIMAQCNFNLSFDQALRLIQHINAIEHNEKLIAIAQKQYKMLEHIARQCSSMAEYADQMVNDRIY
ncbi:hypothetical protein [Desulfobulbus alkaliphilus]|uniref:hypothetical protein n=1 Tax=Desulfobulbus alkaliphilus TaxID=869814 RepID=UPI0019622A4F|nr:hypothetical protein [Desulfobulbus alkaliphilus]MBM9536179.1 hypothetical protein [Desulfobulbus alkaliphilus]